MGQSIAMNDVRIAVVALLRIGRRFKECNKHEQGFHAQHDWYNETQPTFDEVSARRTSLPFIRAIKCEEGSAADVKIGVWS